MKEHLLKEVVTTSSGSKDDRLLSPRLLWLIFELPHFAFCSRLSTFTEAIISTFIIIKAIIIIITIGIHPSRKYLPMIAKEIVTFRFSNSSVRDRFAVTFLSSSNWNIILPT